MKYTWTGPAKIIPGKGVFDKGRVFYEEFFTTDQMKTFKKNRWIKKLTKKEKSKWATDKVDI